MKTLIIVCSSLVAAMLALTGITYYNYKGSYENEHNVYTPKVDTDKHLDSTEIPEWCNDESYIDTVVIPLKEHTYNVDISQDEYSTTEIKNVVCRDTESCGIHESLYHKSIDARDIQIKMKNIEDKLDSISPKKTNIKIVPLRK